jgi:DNA invertase Pin-like site-specific DNA recombinase
MIPPQITDHHRERSAVVYLRSATRTPIGILSETRRELHMLGRQWGWSPSRIVTLQDRGVSGVARARLGFQRLLTEMKADRIGLVLVSDLSRLGRHTTDIALFMTTARQHDVLVAYGQQIVDLRDPNAELTTLILQFNAIRENRARAEQSRLARVKKVQAGVAITRPSVGAVGSPAPPRNP